MKKFLALALFVSGGLFVSAQQTTTQPATNQTAEEDQVFSIAEEMPSYPGGENEMYKFLVKNVRYPEDAKNKGVTGAVLVSFVVGKTGEIRTVGVARSVSPSLDEEAMRVVKAMPKWIPGKVNGKPVSTKFLLPIKFLLR